MAFILYFFKPGRETRSGDPVGRPGRETRSGDPVGRLCWHTPTGKEYSWGFEGP